MDDFELAPFIVDEVFGLGFVQLFLPNVRCVTPRGRKGPHDVVAAADRDPWHAWETGATEDLAGSKLEVEKKPCSRDLVA